VSLSVKGIYGYKDEEMASNPAHKFGQMIGDALEATIEPIIRQFALDHEL
jgi:hypothetical protein